MKPTQHDIPLYQKLPYFDMKTLKVNKTVLRVLTTPRNEKNECKKYLASSRVLISYILHFDTLDSLYKYATKFEKN